MVFKPSVIAIEFPKKELPLAVVLKTLKFAPPAGKEVTFILYV